MNRSEAGKLGYEKSKVKLAENHVRFVGSYYSNPKKCGFCKSVIVFEKRLNDFCNHSCSAKACNAKRNCKEGVKIRQCLFCGKNTNKNAKFFCSRKCQLDSQHKAFIEAWLEGKKDGIISGGMDVSFYIRRWLRERCGDKCELCGWNQKNPKTNKVPLQLDHKDGNAENNSFENLRFLCPNCHSLTPTFGGLNRGKGRKLRYKGNS